MISKKIKGIAGAPGIAIAKALRIDRYIPDVENTDGIGLPSKEFERVQKAIKDTQVTINKQKESMNQRLGEEEAKIFDFYHMVLDDPDLMQKVQRKIEDTHCTAQAAWKEIIEVYAQQTESLDDEYLSERAVDIRDVGDQVLRALLGIKKVDWNTIKQPVIIIAKNLTPSDTMCIDTEKVLGFCTMKGSPTAHSSILARALGIPLVVGAGDTLEDIRDDTEIIMNGDTGEIIISPDDLTKQKYIKAKMKEEEVVRIALGNASKLAQTLDGHRIHVGANIGNIIDAQGSIQLGAEGIGLLRTEFLYLDRTEMPDEDEQIKGYRAIFELIGSKPIVIRTLDIGGDKYPRYMNLDHEDNPFLGWRAIRICLDRPEMLMTQLKAILRAAVGYDVRIMFPMIAKIEELRKAKELLYNAYQELEDQQNAFASHVQIGIMIETPSAVMIADILAKEVDFFSIGSNDLTQYTFAVDRTNEKVAHIADSCHPAILRQIKQVTDAAHGSGIWVGLCGELANDMDAIPVLLGLGIDELSMTPKCIPMVKEKIRNWSLETAQKLAEKALHLATAPEVRHTFRNTQVQ